MKKLSKQSINGFINYALILVLFIIFQSLSGTKLLSSSIKGQLVPICAYVVMALALNLVVGFSGELSLGHAGFMSVGAFTGIVFSSFLKNAIPSDPLRLFVAMACGALMAALAGIIIGVPVLRLRGDYLAIVTLAFGEIIKNIMNCVYVGMDENGLHFSLKDVASMNMTASGKTIINGPQGALGVGKISTFAAGCILIIITLFVIQNLVNSRAGRAIEGIRDNRIAAEACGISITKYKLMAFVTSAALAGAAGVLYAHNYSTVVPKKFDFNTSILVLVFVVLGGIGNLRGSIVAAILLTVLPEVLRQFNDYRMLVYAIVLIIVMVITNNKQSAAFGHVVRNKIFHILPFGKKAGNKSKA